MKRSLLLVLVLALAAVAPAAAHEGWHEATGVVSAISATSITVRGDVVPPLAATPNQLTCAVTTGTSPSIPGLAADDKVYIVCDWVDGRSTLTTLVRQSAVRRFSGPITKLSRTSVTVRTAKGPATCARTQATAAKLHGMKVGHKVTLVCRRTSAKMVLVDVQASGSHAGHGG